MPPKRSLQALSDNQIKATLRKLHGIDDQFGTLPMNFRQLNQECAAYVGVGTRNPMHTLFCVTMDGWPQQEREQRRVVEITLFQGCLYLHTKQPDRTRHDEDRFLERVAKKAEWKLRQRDDLAFVPLVSIGSGVINWVIEKCVKYLINLWRNNPEFVQSVGDMLPTGVAWEDEPCTGGRQCR